MSKDRSSEIVHREIDTDSEGAAIEIAKAVADIEGKQPNELDTIWGCIDGALDEIFSNPPSQDAQLEVTFSYEGYRITVEQNGRAQFVKTD